MKKSLRKVIVTLSAVAALSLAMGATAMADVTTSEIQDGKATVTYTTTATAGEQVTVLLLKPTADSTDGISAEEIAYIDQKAAESDGSVSFVMPITGVAEGQSYALMSGSESATAPSTGSADFAAPVADVKYGDINDDGDITNDDALQIMYYGAFMSSTLDNDPDGALMARAKITDGDEDVTNDDALQIMYYGAFMDNTLEAKLGWMN